MRSWRRSLLLAVALAAVTGLALVPGSAPVKAAARLHPRLLFTPADIAALRQKVTNGIGADDTEFQRNGAQAVTLLSYSDGALLGAYWGVYNVTQLGLAYRLAPDSDTNKPRFRNKCQELLSYIATTYGPEAANAHDSSLRLFALSLGFDLCFDELPDASPVPANRQEVIDEIIAYLRPDPDYQTSLPWFDWWTRSTPPYTSNKGVILGSAMGLGSIVLRGETDQTAILDEALAWGHTMVLNNFNAVYDADGSYREGELYGPFATRYLIPYVEARARYDGVDLSTRDELKNFGNWLAYGILPTSAGYSIMSNNGNYSLHVVAWNDTYQSWAQTKYGSQVARYVYDYTSGLYDYGYQHDRMAAILWNQGPATAEPSSELPDSRLFRGRGFYIYRTGWPAPWETASDDTVFTLYAGSFGGGHAQEDQGTFSLYSKRTWFSRDSGYAAGAEQSEGHNLVFIDNAGQHFASRSIGTEGRIPAWNLGPFADYLQADTKDAYTTYSPLNAPNYPFPGSDWSWGYQGANPVQRANRHVLVVKASAEAPEYFILYDDIVKDGNPHTYDWTMHTEQGFTLSTAANPIVVTGTGATPPRRLKVRFANPPFGNLTFSSAPYDLGSVDPDTTRIKATVSGVTNPNFFVALQPVIDGATPEPTFSVPSGVSNALAARYAWATATDDVYVRQSGNIQHVALSSDAQMLLVRRDGVGAIAKFSLGQGSFLQEGAATLVQVSGGTASVTSDGTTVSVSDPNRQYVIYGPAVTRVTSNRELLAFQRAGNFVYLNASPSTPITISGLATSGISDAAATVSWTTSVPSTSWVEYGPTTSYGNASTISQNATTHTVTISGLQPNTLYHFRVRAQSGSTDSWSADQTFRTTAPAPDTTPPAAVTDLRTS